MSCTVTTQGTRLWRAHGVVGTVVNLDRGRAEARDRGGEASLLVQEAGDAPDVARVGKAAGLGAISAHLAVSSRLESKLRPQSPRLERARASSTM